MIDAPAIVLVAHGSPDHDWRRPLDRVLAMTRQQAPGTTVELAFLSHNEPSLEACCDAVVSNGAQHIRVIAAFLSAGGKHLKRDIPEQVAAIARRHPGVQIELVPGALGDDAAVVEALAAAALARGRE